MWIFQLSGPYFQPQLLQFRWHWHCGLDFCLSSVDLQTSIACVTLRALHASRAFEWKPGFMVQLQIVQSSNFELQLQHKQKSISNHWQSRKILDCLLNPSSKWSITNIENGLRVTIFDWRKLTCNYILSISYRNLKTDIGTSLNVWRGFKRNRKRKGSGDCVYKLQDCSFFVDLY